MPTLVEALKKRMETANTEFAAAKRSKPVKKKSTKARKRPSDKEKIAKLWANLEKKK